MNHNGVCDSTDIDAIFQHLGSVSTNPALAQYDVNGDGVVSANLTSGDVEYELVQVFQTNYGDANLDHYTDFTDFQIVLDHWITAGGWADGDFNGDGQVDFTDFQIVLDYWNPNGW